MDKSNQGKMVGAVFVLGLSVGIGTDLAFAEEAAQITAKSTSTNPQVFKFAVDTKKPGQPTAAKYDGIDGESNDARGKQPSGPQPYIKIEGIDGESVKHPPAGADPATAKASKIEFTDIIVSSAKGENPAPAANQGAMDPSSQPRIDKFDPKRRSNAKRMHKP